MAQLLIREFPEALVLALEERAAVNGRSADAEHRVILEEAFRKPQRVPQAGDVLRKASLLGQLATEQSLRKVGYDDTCLAHVTQIGEGICPGFQCATCNCGWHSCVFGAANRPMDGAMA